MFCLAIDSNTGWSAPPANWQAECDRLAGLGASNAVPFSYPLPDTLDGLHLMFRRGRLVVDPRHTFNDIYSLAVRSPLDAVAVELEDKSALSAWEDAVSRGVLSPGALRYAMWLRSAHETHEAQGPRNQPSSSYAVLA